MKNHPRSLCILLLLALSAPRAQAGVAVQLAGVKDARECSYATVPLLEILNTYAKFPSGWTVVVACSELTWQLLRTRAGATNTNHAFTNAKGHVTVVNGAIFRSPEFGRPPRRILAHELGHVKCGCDDESKAERYALSLEK